MTSEGQLCNRDGFRRAFSDLLYDENDCLLSGGGCTGHDILYHNHDLHHQGATPREPITFEMESTGSDGARRLFAGTTSRLYWLNEPAGTWTTIASGLGAGDSYWQGATLQDIVIFSNGVDNILQHTLGSATTSTIPDLITLGVTAAKVVIEYQGFIFLMNYTQNGARKMSSVRWSDLNLPLDYNQTSPPSLNGRQDLDYGDEILAALPMLGSLYIYTRRSIWRVTVSGDANSTWSFIKVYTEPKNQTGCLVYPRTLVSTGSDHYYMSRDSIYHFNPFLAAPVREEWTRRADGVIYTKADTKLSGVLCNAPCGEYRPGLKELWFSWPSGSRILNNWTLALNIEREAADVIDNGFTAMVNYRRAATLGICNELQDFICASSIDLCLKSIGGALYREFVHPVDNDITNDLPETLPTSDYYTTGYARILRGLIPLGLTDRQKMVNNVLLSHESAAQDKPCVVQLRIGNAYTLVDPNAVGDTAAPMWTVIKSTLTGLPWLPLEWPSVEGLAAMRAKGQKPFKATEWQCYEENVYLYWELTVLNSDGTPAIGGDSCFERIDFRARPSLGR